MLKPYKFFLDKLKIPSFIGYTLEKIDSNEYFSSFPSLNKVGGIKTCNN